MQKQAFASAVASRIKVFTQKCVRVWNVLRKPTREEFSMVSKVSGIGILIIGALGFIISIVLAILK